ncbi:hypothetical protein L3Q82_016613, partial [Scortum barcoo]
PVQGSGEPPVTSSNYPDLSKVPPCYHDLKEVFSKVKPPCCPLIMNVNEEEVTIPSDHAMGQEMQKSLGSSC